MNESGQSAVFNQFDKAKDIANALRYLERQAAGFGFGELATLIGTAALVARELTQRPQKRASQR